MDTDIDLVVENGTMFPPLGAFAAIRELFAEQERRFSRFLPGSLVSRLNREGAVDDGWLAAACRLAFEAYEFTGGIFNPLVLGALEDAGYAGTFASVAGGRPSAERVPPLDECMSVRGSVVQLSGARLDLGGIVKGWTVDLAADLLAESEANGVVNAGGDLRCIGAEPHCGGWFVSVANLHGREGYLWEGEMRGALATSTTLKRRWRTDSGEAAHHLIDPRTGLPAASGYVQVSAWHPLTWQAECWAKAVLIGGEPAARLAAASGVRILAVEADGRTVIQP